MGKVVTTIKLSNLSDATLFRAGARKDKIRETSVEALVDTGATRLYLKRSVIRTLGLRKSGSVVSQTTNGPCRRSVYEPVKLELMKRRGTFDVVEVEDTVPNLLGQIPLEYLDFVVDPRAQKLIANPEHRGRMMTEEFRN